MFKKTQGCFKPLKLTVAFKETIYNYVVLSKHLYYSIKLMYSCKDYKYHEIIYTYMRHQEVYNNVNNHNTLKYTLVKWTSFCTDLVGVGFCQGQIVLPHGVSLHLDHSVVGQETITDVLRQSLVHSRQVQGIGGGGL